MINLLDEIPERSQMILDTLANEYIQYTLENQFRINQNTMTYINYQVEDVVDIIDSIQYYELQNMRDKKGILDVDKESEKYFQSLMQHESNKRKLKLKIKSLENLKKYLQILIENILPPSLYVMSEDQYLSNSINDFYENQLKKMEMTHGFKRSSRIRDDG